MAQRSSWDFGRSGERLIANPAEISTASRDGCLGKDMSQEHEPITRNPAGGVASAKAELDGARVAAFLRKNPDFLLRHPDLIATLTPPAKQTGDNVEDFQNFLIARLRAEAE